MYRLILTWTLLFSILFTSGCITFGKVNTGVQEDGSFISPHFKESGRR